jgi:TolB-like protein
MLLCVFFSKVKTSIVLFSCLLALFFSRGIPAWGGCKASLELYTQKKFDYAIKLAYAELEDTSLNVVSRLCTYKVLGICYYAKGDLYQDSVEFYMKEIVRLSPEYTFDPNDNWPPYCRSLIYQYQREWREADPSASTSEVTTLTILPFENRSIVDKEELDPLREGLADMLITDLSKVINLRIVERERLQSLLEELGISQSPLVDEKTAVKVGKILGAQSMLFGSFLKLDRRHMRIDVRIIKTETAELIKADKLEGNPKKLLKMIGDLALKVAQHLNVAVSALERERITGVGERSWDAVLHYSQGLRFEDQGDYNKACEMFERALKIDPGFLEAKKKLYNLQPLVE